MNQACIILHPGARMGQAINRLDNCLAMVLTTVGNFATGHKTMLSVWPVHVRNGPKMRTLRLTAHIFKTHEPTRCWAHFNAACFWWQL